MGEGVAMPRVLRRPWTDRDDEMLKAFVSVGWDDVRIGRLLERNRLVVMRRRRLLNIPRVPHPCRKSAH